MKRIFAVALVLCFVAGTAAADTVRIGMTAPLTGPWATEGQEMKQIVTLLAEEVNAKGGIDGRKVELIIEDDAGDPKTAALAATRLTTQDIAGSVGAYGSSITEAQQNIFDEAKIVQVATGSTAIRLTEKGLKYFFRTSPRDDEQGRVAAEYVRELGVRRLALLHDNSTYAKGLAEEIKGHLSELVVFYDALTPGERDFSAILTKMKATEPDLVFFSGYYPEMGLLLRQKKEMGWKVSFCGGDSHGNPDLVKIAGKDAAEGMWFLSPPVPQDLTTEEAKSFLDSYTRKYGQAPASIWATLAGDAFKVLVAAVRATGSTDSDKIADYLHNDMKNLPCLTGTISFNQKGDRIGDLYRVYEYNAEGKPILIR